MKKLRTFHSNAVWPPPVLIGLFIVAWAIVEGGILLIQIMTPGYPLGTADMDEISGIRTVVLACAAAVYVLVRLWRFHPVCNPAYVAWLELSPWTSNKPLPLGPIHLAWQDAVVVGVLTALARWHAQVSAEVPLIAFGVTYLCGLNLLLALTRRWTSCLVLGFLWPILILPQAKGWPDIAVFAAIVLVLWHGIRASLRAFPQGFVPGSVQTLSQRPRSLLQVQFDLRVPGLSSQAFDTSSKAIGWPYLALSPKVEFPSVSTRTSFFMALLLGWWTFCMSLAFEDAPNPGFLLFLGLMLAGIRLLIYCLNVAAPFNLWGRLATGRLVLPGFDRVFLTPLAVIVLAGFGGAVLRGAASHAALAGACVVAVLWFVVFAGGPTLRDWLLTSEHRHRAPRMFSAKQPIRPL